MNILLPIETINREIDSRVVLASLLSGQGHKIYVGQHDFLMTLLPNIKEGIYVGKNIFSKRSDQEQGQKYYQLKEKNVDVIYLHEEGAVYTGNEQNWEQVLKRQYDLKYFDQDDRICVWGDFQSQVDGARGKKVPISVTGHPRFDLYKKKWNSYFDVDVRKIKEKFSNYILINSNYGLANHGLGIEYVFSNSFNYLVDDVVARLERVGFYAYSAKQMASMVELTHQLAVRYPNKTFIYRPHPSENHDYYKAVFAGVSNIQVNHEGAVGSWILGAEAVIHDGCTTAIEASLADVPVINFKPLYNEQFDIWLPNQLGKRAESFDDVFNILDNLNEFDYSFEDGETFEKVCSLFYNFKGDSYDKIIEIIESKAKEKIGVSSESPSLTFIKSEYLKMRSKQEILKAFSTDAAKKSKYHQTKFYGLTQNMISEKFGQAEQLLNKSVKYKLHNKYLIEVQ